MASLLLNKAGKMKQRLHKSLAVSCSSSASTSVVAFSSGRAIIDRHSPHPPRSRRLTAAPSSSVPNSISSSSSSPTKLKKKKKKKTPTNKSPVSSSRFLLNSSRLQLEQSDVPILDSLPPQLPPSSFIDFFPVTDQQIVESSTQDAAAAKDDDNHHQQQAVITRRSTSCSTIRSQRHQEVVLKVSLHCKGCAGKVKKHISKMEGVTCFDIDIATKKVTVMGDVTPLGVLNCISKVKSAQFWPSSSSPPRASASF